MEVRVSRRRLLGATFVAGLWPIVAARDPAARPARVEQTDGFERWDGGGALGYLTLTAICDALVSYPPERSRVVVAESCFPSGVLGAWARRLAHAGLVAVVTATSPARLPHPEGGPPLTGTIPTRARDDCGRPPPDSAADSPRECWVARPPLSDGRPAA